MSENNQGGRPPSLTTAVVALADQHFEKGSLGVASFASEAGVTIQSVYGWLAKGRTKVHAPRENLSEHEALCVELFKKTLAPASVVQDAWKAITDNLRSKKPCLATARWVVDNHLALYLKD